MIGGTYVLTALIAIFIYSSRLYTNRSVLAGVGKAYIPVEDGEVGRNVRKMIVSQLERSAIIAWEARPTLVLPRERRRLAGFAHGRTIVARLQRVAFPSPQNRPCAALLRMCNASLFLLLVPLDFLHVLPHGRIVGTIALSLRMNNKHALLVT